MGSHGEPPISQPRRPQPHAPSAAAAQVFLEQLMQRHPFVRQRAQLEMHDQRRCGRSLLPCQRRVLLRLERLGSFANSVRLSASKSWRWHDSVHDNDGKGASARCWMAGSAGQDLFLDRIRIWRASNSPNIIFFGLSGPLSSASLREDCRSRRTCSKLLNWQACLTRVSWNGCAVQRTSA